MEHYTIYECPECHVLYGKPGSCWSCESDDVEHPSWRPAPLLDEWPPDWYRHPNPVHQEHS